MNEKYQNVNLRNAIYIRTWYDPGTALVRLKCLKGERDKKQVEAGCQGFKMIVYP